ncbi:hypothetical protein Q5692_21575 [Microcoleus sp. C2C3]|uniref:hypothetical protein n=1 Tax=unclassified Microcoleus TaxID=2642155 RepID=UPI002FCFCF57
MNKVIESDKDETKYFYEVGGDLERTELPNGVVENRNYDELNRWNLLQYQRNGMTLQSFDYTLDSVGNRRVII